jgi:hypothetical protein
MIENREVNYLYNSRGERVPVPERKKSRRRMALALLVVLACAVALSPWIVKNVSALFNPDTAVHVDPRQIENGTLAIGTHLIYLGSLTPEIYDRAEATVSESNQSRIYYKSELANGAWCDITTANSLAAIASSFTDPTGTVPPAIVNDSVIADLLLTHHTKADGVTYDLRTGAAVNIFNQPDPYDLYNMEELAPLRQQYDMYVESKPSNAKDDDAKKMKRQRQEKIDRIDVLWNMNVRNDITNDADSSLAALQRYYEIISREEEAKPEMEAVQAVMAAVDATRRYQVFFSIEGALNDFIGEAMSAATPDTEYLTDSNLTSALSESLGNVETSLTDMQGKMLSPGNTILSDIRYQTSYNLINNARSGNDAAADLDVIKLIDLSNIEDGDVVNAGSEADLLTNELIPRATDKLRNLLASGANAEYQQAAAQNQAGAVLRAIAKTALSDDNAARSELESFITAYADRIAAETSIEFIDARIVITQGWITILPSDGFMDNSNSCITDHLTFLMDLKNAIESALGSGKFDDLNAQKAALQTEYMSALDKGDLTGAKDAQDKMSAIDAQIAALESGVNEDIGKLQAQIDELSGQINARESGMGDGDGDGDGDGFGSGSGAGLDAGDGSGSASGQDSVLDGMKRDLALLESKLASLLNSLPDGAQSKQAAELRANALDVINNGGDIGMLGDTVSALGALAATNPNAAVPALKELYTNMQQKNALEGNNNFDAIIDTAANLIAENQAAYENSLTGDANADKLAAIAAEYLASGAPELSGLSGDAKAIAYVNALKEFAETTGSGVVQGMMQAEAQNQLALGNALVFRQYSDPTAQYVPVTALASHLGMRYVYNRNLNQAALAKGSSYYAFQAYADQVKMGSSKDQTEYLSRPTGLLGCIYIPADYVTDTFVCYPVYLPGTNLGILMDEQILAVSDALLASFMAQ